MATHRRYSRYFSGLFLLIDLICLNGCVFLASFLRFGTAVPSEEYQFLQLILNVIWVGVFFSARLQKINRNSRLLDHLNQVLTGLVINLSIVFALWFAVGPGEYSRKFLFYTYLFFTLSILSWRIVWHFFIRFYRSKGYNVRNVLIVGGGDVANMLIESFGKSPELGYKLVGNISSDDKSAIAYPKLEELVMERNTDIIFCHLPSLTEDRIKEIIDFAENNLIKVNLISQFSRLLSHKLSIEQYGNIPIINVNITPLDQTANRLIKRSFDLFFSSLFIIGVLSWLVPIVGLVIKLDSKGPIFFKQKRHGKGNEAFLCWKFRTMIVQRRTGFKQAERHDPRVTRIGAILRRTSIDELPQFINVFLGNMSIVGPRPHPIKLNEEFQPKIDRFWQRHAVKPGITGLAQAKGFRGETAAFSDMSGRVKLDRFYVKNWSLSLDLRIIILTALAILRGDQDAY